MDFLRLATSIVFKSLEIVLVQNDNTFAASANEYPKYSVRTKAATIRCSALSVDGFLCHLREVKLSKRYSTL